MDGRVNVKKWGFVSCCRQPLCSFRGSGTHVMRIRQHDNRDLLYLFLNTTEFRESAVWGVERVLSN